jgi:hypothetical protein
MHRRTSEWLLAIRWRTPGSWERSRISDIDSSCLTNPPEPKLRRVFCFPEQRFVQRSEKSGDPDPGLARAIARATSAGPAGGNGASDRGPPMAGRTLKGSLGDAAYSRASRQYSFCNLVAAFAAQRTLVVKISDTSLLVKAGSNPAFDVTYRGGGWRGRRVAGSGSSARKRLR